MARTALLRLAKAAAGRGSMPAEQQQRHSPRSRPLTTSRADPMQPSVQPTGGAAHIGSMLNSVILQLHRQLLGRRMNGVDHAGTAEQRQPSDRLEKVEIWTCANARESCGARVSEQWVHESSGQHAVLVCHSPHGCGPSYRRDCTRPQ